MPPRAVCEIDLDAITANVEVLDADSTSILHLYRRLIRLRRACPALGADAELVPVRASSSAVVAYLRQSAGAAALVVANLGEEPLRGVELSAEQTAIPPDTDYMPRVVLGGAPATELLAAGETGGHGYLVETRALDDHQPLTQALLTRLEKDAQAARAQLVTTEKDAVRLPQSYRMKVLTVPVRLTILEDGPLKAALADLFD